MRKLHGFTVLETDEEIEKFGLKCDHKFKEAPVSECINPNGEFVIGYGNWPVIAPVGKREVCVKCGYFKKGR